MYKISKDLERQEANRINNQKQVIPLCKLYKILQFNQSLQNTFLAQLQ